MMDKEVIQQLADMVIAPIKSELDGLREDVRRVEQGVEKIDSLQADIDGLRADVSRGEQRDKELRRDISRSISREIREQSSRDRDRMEMLENRIGGLTVLGGDRGPEPAQYVSTGTGLIDPEWRWEREHPFRR